MFNEVSFLLHSLIEAHRREERQAYEEILFTLKKYSKNSIYRYHAVLKPFGYELTDLRLMYDNYLLEFLQDIEFPISNIVTYFIGYISHKFYKIIERENVGKRRANNSYNSINAHYILNEVAESYIDTIQSEENISEWFNLDEVIKTYLSDESNSILNREEKDVLIGKLEGKSINEISEEWQIPYKVIYNYFTQAKNKLIAAFA